MVSVLTQTYTVDDLLRLDAEDKHYEIIHGELVEMSPVGFRDSSIISNLAFVISPHAKQNKLGHFHPSSLIYELASAECLVPKCSFIRKGRIPRCA